LIHPIGPSPQEHLSGTGTCRQWRKRKLMVMVDMENMEVMGSSG